MYEKQNFTDGQVLTAEHLNKMEDGIVANETELENKQPKGDYLTEHQKIKTINGQEIIGEGNLEIKAEIPSELKTVEGKTLTISDAKAGTPLSFEAVGYTEAYGKSKNLFDIERASVFDNYIVVNLGGTNRRVIKFDLKPNTTYTYSRIKISGLPAYQNMALFNSEGTTKSTLNNDATTMTTSDDGLLYFGTSATALTSAAQLKFHEQYENIQLEEGDVATPYEPFRDTERIVNAGTVDEETGKYNAEITSTNGVEIVKATLSLDRPLAKWDYLTKKDGAWGISYNSETIDSYNGESITTEFVSPSGELVEGSCVQYKTETETFVALDSETQEELNALVLYNLSTQITNDSSLTFVVTYEVNDDAKIIASSVYVNVKDYGALGDGETDDTAAIRTARDVARLNKKALYFPAGTYMLSGCIQLYSDMHVIGEKDATLKKYTAVVQKLTANAAAGDTVVYVSNASSYKVGQDIYIGLDGSGNYADTVGYITAIDTDTNAITFEVYPRHSEDKNAGLARAVSTSGYVSTSFPLLCTFRYDDAGGNIKIEGLTFDGNKLTAGEPNAYQLSMIHIDPNEMDVTVNDCRVINSNADGISLQNGGQTTVYNCIIDTTGYHGIHPGFTTIAVSISNCHIYNCPNSGVYDCYDVDGMSVVGCYFYNCFYGIGGLDVESNGSNIVGCTFVNCNEGVYLRATNGGASVVGCSFQKCDIGVSGYVSGTASVTGCMFVECGKAALFRNAWDMVFNSNVIRECTLPVSCEVYSSGGTTKYNSNIIITDNVFSAIESNRTSTIGVAYCNSAIIKNNILTGTDANISIDPDTTTDIIIADNIGTIIEN